MKVLVKSGRVVDPANNIDEKLDILIDQNNRLIEILEKQKQKNTSDSTK